MYCLIQIKYIEFPQADRHDLELLTPIGLPVVAANVPRPSFNVVSLFPATMIPELTAMLNRQYQGWSLYSANNIYKYDSNGVFAGAYIWLWKENEVKEGKVKLVGSDKEQPKQGNHKGRELAKFGELKGWSNGRILNGGKPEEGNVEEKDIGDFEEMEVGDCEEDSSKNSVLTPKEDEELVLVIR